MFVAPLARRRPKDRPDLWRPPEDQNPSQPHPSQKKPWATSHPRQGSISRECTGRFSRARTESRKRVSRKRCRQKLRTRDPHTSTLGPQSGNADGHLPAPIAAGGSSTKSVFPMVRSRNVSGPRPSRVDGAGGHRQWPAIPLPQSPWANTRGTAVGYRRCACRQEGPGSGGSGYRQVRGAFTAVRTCYHCRDCWGIGMVDYETDGS